MVIKFYKQIFIWIITFIIIIQLSCKDDIIDNTDSIIGTIPGEWVSYGFEDKIPYRMVLDGTTLYACAGKDGLWRKDISINDSPWQYLGLADSSGLFPPLHTVTDVDIYNDTLLAAMYWLNEREVYNDVGIWKSTDNGLTWNRSDSGIAVIDWPYSSMWSVKRSPFFPHIIISSVGTNFRSSDAGNYWYKVFPVLHPGSETFVSKITWHPKRENEVWVYGQGNTYEPILEVSRDGGITWDDRWNNGITGLNLGGDAGIIKVAFDAVKENIVYLSCGYGILRSSSSGEDWLNQNWQTPPYILSPYGESLLSGLETNPLISGEAYFAGGNNLYLTKNFGENFFMNKIPNNSSAQTLVFCKELDVIIIRTDSGIIGFRLNR